MISLQNLGMSYGARVLFTRASLHLSENVKYGVTGANGSGKSTLLRLIAGREQPSEGKIEIAKGARIAFLEQNLPIAESNTPIEIVIGGNQALAQALRQREDPTLDFQHAGEVEETIRAHDGYRAQAEAARILSGLGLPDGLHSMPAHQLSGGQMMRVLIARALFARGDVLLLDEPNNHLDLPSMVWLENFLLSEFRGTLLLITHDRGFLAAIAEQIIDVDYRTITLYSMNYHRFAIARSIAAEQKEREAESAKRKIAELQEFVDRFRAKASKARQAQSRVKQIERIEIPEIIPSSRRKPAFVLRYEREPGRDVLNLRRVAMGFAAENGNVVELFRDAELQLRRGDKAAIVGPNGHGKTTLLKIIAGTLSPHKGVVHLGHEVRMGYYAQVHDDLRKLATPMYEYLHDRHPEKPIKEIRTALGLLLFEGDEQKKKLCMLSGGEMARLVFADLILQRPNFLVLDEPTNHLDIEGIEALEKSLIDYRGTILMVSHDRAFIQNTCNRVFSLKNGVLQELIGGVADLGVAPEAESGSSTRERLSHMPCAKAPTPLQNKPSYEERKRLKSEAAKLQTRIAKLEQEIAELETEIAELDALFADSTKLPNLSAEELRRQSENRESRQKLLDEKIAEWEKLSAVAGGLN